MFYIYFQAIIANNTATTPKIKVKRFAEEFPLPVSQAESKQVDPSVQ